MTRRPRHPATGRLHAAAATTAPHDAVPGSAAATTTTADQPGPAATSSVSGRSPRLTLVLAATALLTAACDDLIDPVTPEPEPEPSVLRFDPDGADFYRMPWPHDARRTDAGTVDVLDFPNPRNVSLLKLYLEVATRDVQGFATMPVVYVASDEPLDPSALPTPAGSRAPEALVQLVALSDERCGERVPIDVQVRDDGDRFEAPHMLVAAPTLGATLHPATPYALLLRRGLSTAGGDPVAPAPAFRAALRGTHPDGRLVASHAPLHRCMPELADDDDLLLATVFTTQDPVEELLRLRETVRDPDALTLPELVDLERSAGWSTGSRDVWFGVFEAPIFLAGETPYTAEGGELVFDDAGAPVVQRWEDVPFTVTLPAGASGPLPVVVWLDGTGATLTSPIGDGWYTRALAEGMAVATFVAPFHDSRAVAGSDEVLSSFNFLNPAAGRTVFRQQATEVSVFLRVLAEQVNPWLADAEVAASLDLERAVYGGHSQGALVGSLAIAVEPDFHAAVLNGTGGWLAVTVTERKDVLDIALLVRTLFGTRNPLDRFHPVVQLVQMSAEVVDPHNYVRRWRGSPEDPDGLHVLVINGDEDPTTHVDSVDQMTLTAGLPLIEPAGWDPDPHGLFDVRRVTLPLSPDTATPGGEPVLHATWLEGGGGHFTIYRSAAVRDLAVQLWRSTVDGAPALGEAGLGQEGLGQEGP